MPVIATLKSSRTREKKALLKEEAEAQKILQIDFENDRTEIGRHLLTTGKVLINLKMTLSRLELANEKLNEAYKQNHDEEGAGQFQLTLDEEGEFIDEAIDKMSQLKILKEELEQRRRASERTPSENVEARISDAPLTTGMVNIWAPQTIGPLKPPQLEITPFNGDILKWHASFGMHLKHPFTKLRSYAPVDKLNYLKSKLKGEALEAISGYQLFNENYAVVVEVLKRRFGNQQLIIDAHYCNLQRTKYLNYVNVMMPLNGTCKV